MTVLTRTFGIAARNFTAYPEMPSAKGLVEYGVRVEELGTKKPLTIRINAASQLKNIPDMRKMQPAQGHGGPAPSTDANARDGEFFIRALVAHEISALIEDRGLSLSNAAESALAKSQKLGGSGGLIAVDKNGTIALPFNTSGMYRGFLREDGTFVVDIYRDR